MLRHFFLACVLFCASLSAQVHYYEDGRPWRQKANGGPDQEVPGWFYNLGETGLRVELVADAPTHLVVRHVMEGSPAKGLIEAGDHLVGAGSAKFETPHQNGYGEALFGPAGPIADFAQALEAASAAKAPLELQVLRKGKVKSLKLPRFNTEGAYSESFPFQCKKTEAILADLLSYLAKEQRDDGSYGSPPHNLFAPLALLASGESRYAKAVERAARFHARTTEATDKGGLINWRYCAAGIFLSEYYLATKAAWVLPELREVRDFLLRSQFTDAEQINPKAKESHPGSFPKTDDQAKGGFGHNPGFEGYGPIAMITGQAALAFAMMEHCGVPVPRQRLDAAYDFLKRGTGRNGYLWYGDSVAKQNGFADMGRTGASGIAHWLSPYEETTYRDHARLHAQCIAEHPLSFPDTHGSPTMGMVYAALATHAVGAEPFQRLMRANRYWFTLARCQDGTFYYQPNRDNAGYGADSRLSATAVTALIFSLPKKSLLLSGKSFKR